MVICRTFFGSSQLLCRNAQRLFEKAGQLDEPVHAKLIDALLASQDDPLQQIHYFYCLRLIPEGWSAEHKQAVSA